MSQLTDAELSRLMKFNAAVINQAIENAFRKPGTALEDAMTQVLAEYLAAGLAVPK